MKKIRALLALFLCLVIFVAPVLAADETTAATPDDASQSADTSAEAAVSAAPEYHANAKAALLIDLNTGRSIFEQDADEQVYPCLLYTSPAIRALRRHPPLSHTYHTKKL